MPEIVVMRGMWDVASDPEQLDQVRMGLQKHKVTASNQHTRDAGAVAWPYRTFTPKIDKEL